MKKIKKILNIAFVLMIIITVIVINKTYALFESNLDLLINMDVARWNITVNDTMVNSESVQSFVIKNLQLNANSKVENGKVAPGSQGTFDVEMDFKDTDVSVKCELEVDGERMNEAGLSFSSFVMDDSTVTLQYVSENKYSFIVPLSKIKASSNSYKLMLRITFKWENDETRNEEDTLIGTSTERQKLQVPITLRFTQYTGQ